MSSNCTAERETREIALMVCQAVSYLHSRGITHRDLKPENLLLTKSSKPVCKVTDFGLAKMVTDQTMLRTMCGKLSTVRSPLFPRALLSSFEFLQVHQLTSLRAFPVSFRSFVSNCSHLDVDLTGKSSSTRIQQQVTLQRSMLGLSESSSSLSSPVKHPSTNPNRRLYRNECENVESISDFWNQRD